MKTKKIVNALGRKFFITVGLCQGVFILAMCISPIVWIWGDFNAAWKVCLTAFLLLLIFKMVANVVEKVLTQHVEEALAEMDLNVITEPINIKSKFMQKLEKAMEENASKKIKFKSKLDKMIDDDQALTKKLIEKDAKLTKKLLGEQ